MSIAIAGMKDTELVGLLLQSTRYFLILSAAASFSDLLSPRAHVTPDLAYVMRVSVRVVCVCVCQAAGCACKYELMQELCVYVCVCVCDQIFNIGAPTKWTGPNRKIMSRTPVVKHAAVLVQSHHPPADGIALTNKNKKREREGVLGGVCEQCKTARLVFFLSLYLSC